MLCARPLKALGLRDNDIGDDGVAALVAPVLPSLEILDLACNQIGDAGCASLVAALSLGSMPSLTSIDLERNPASKPAVVEVECVGSVLGSNTIGGD